MSLWEKVCKLEGEPLRQIQNLYGPNFPIEFRHYFADIIESRRWDDLDPDNPQHETYAKHIFDTFIDEIEKQYNSVTGADFLRRLRLDEIANNFKSVYGPAPLELVRTIKRILATETRLVNQASAALEGGTPASMTQVNEKVNQIKCDLDRLASMTRDTENDLRNLQSKQEYFVINYQESLKIQSNLQQVQQMPQDQTRIHVEQKLIQKQQEVDRLLRAEAQILLNQRLSLADKHSETFQYLTNLQNQILDEELIQWKRAQALAYNGVQQETNLDQLQHWCERLAEIIWQNRQQIKRVEMLRQQLPINNPGPGPDLLPELNANITALLSTLVTSTFIIEKQPPQVLKTQTRFGATIRLLVGGKLNVHMNPPSVKASIISELQAKTLLKNETGRDRTEVSGEILNRESVMEYHPQSGILSVNFRNMSLRRIKRSDKRGAESVTEEKFTILFQSQFSVGGNELVFQVRTLSLPVVVIVHGNQEANAAASILWDNAFAEQGRIPFQVPDKVPWNKLIETLDHKWKHECQSSRGLTTMAKQYLAQKVFRQNVPANSDKNISWANFNREPLPKRNFTFWQWFNGVMELTKSKHLQQHWDDGAIIGFIGKQESQEKLLSKHPQSFLLRYSDSEIGGLTIAWIDEHDKVWNLMPHTLHDYKIRSLADRIKDLNQLMYLCKSDDTVKPKDEVFRHYYQKIVSNSSPPNGGYVRTELMQTIPAIAPASALMMSDMSSPNTPTSYDQQFMHNSPAPGQSISSEASNSGFHVGAEVTGGMEYDETINDFESCNIDVNELLRGT